MQMLGKKYWITHSFYRNTFTQHCHVFMGAFCTCCSDCILIRVKLRRICNTHKMIDFLILIYCKHFLFGNWTSYKCLHSMQLTFQLCMGEIHTKFKHYVSATFGILDTVPTVLFSCYHTMFPLLTPSSWSHLFTSLTVAFNLISPLRDSPDYQSHSPKPKVMLECRPVVYPWQECVFAVLLCLWPLTWKLFQEGG